MPADHVDRMIDSWAKSAPETDVSVLHVVGRILRAAALLERELQGALRPHGLSFADFDVLNTLRREGGRDGLNPRELAATALITTGAMTSRLDRLESAGLITREADPSDRRAVRVRLTTRGRQTATRALKAVLEADRAFLDPLTKTEDAALKRGLKRLLLAHDPG